MDRTQRGDRADDGDLADDRADDVVEQDGYWFPALKWRPPVLKRRPPTGVLLLAAGLLAGLVIGACGGYAAGTRHIGNPADGSNPADAANPAASGTGPGADASSGARAEADSLALAEAGDVCSAQVGRELQLGVHVTNQSGARLTLRHVRAVLPLAGLRPLSARWAPCGVLPGGLPGSLASGGRLPPGASAWFTVTFRVLVKCPGPLPVQFLVFYDQGGLSSSVSLPAFSDLSGVPYSGCQPRPLPALPATGHRPDRQAGYLDPSRPVPVPAAPCELPRPAARPHPHPPLPRSPPRPVQPRPAPFAKGIAAAFTAFARSREGDRCRVHLVRERNASDLRGRLGLFFRLFLLVVPGLRGRVAGGDGDGGGRVL